MVVFVFWNVCAGLNLIRTLGISDINFCFLHFLGQNLCIDKCAYHTLSLSQVFSETDKNPVREYPLKQNATLMSLIA